MMNYFGLNIYYYKFNGEIINSCLDTNGNILIEFYTDNLKIYHYKIIKKNKSPMYGYSILYSNFIGKYFFISEEEQFKLLNGDDDDFENIKNNFNIEDYLIEEEKEESENEKESGESQESEEIQTEPEEENNQKPEKPKESEKSNNSQKNSISTGIIIIIALLSCINLTFIGYFIYKKFKKPIDINNEELPAPINN